ncbi:DUF3012 domain-containing protein [Shewanella sp. KX20019]|uniref:DUF3012 domain-containing protein n=1 Tax=Shewanella sp. KX20019 TaxID=2803864 RepID=UPI0019293679|nr:DUF3012 domain-containing protein [Shewanella sp. KX20019]QQX80716.1 DUF3012 domain-containing protein [Shewanella sp. KX20019]
MFLRKLSTVCLALALAVGVTACSPEVGSEAWCKQMSDKPSGDWSTNEATDYAKHCVFK